MGNEIIKISKKRYQFHIIRELTQIEQLDNGLPNETEVRKYISIGGFSSIGFIKFIAEKTHINRLFVTTLRVGRKHLQVLDVLHKQGKLDNACFAIGSVMKNDSKIGKSYRYYDDLKEVCETNNWQIFVINNHSKVLLFDTFDGFFVIETSSNLNENPHMEQFSFEKSKELYDFYLEAFYKIIGGERWLNQFQEKE